LDIVPILGTRRARPSTQRADAVGLAAGDGLGELFLLDLEDDVLLEVFVVRLCGFRAVAVDSEDVEVVSTKKDSLESFFAA
jgi:hypothetical protein